MYDLINKKLHKKADNIIILGISPFSITDQAIENGHIKRINNLKNEEIIEYLYLKKIKNKFVPIDPINTWNSIFKKETIIYNYVQKVNVNEGWVESDYIQPNQYSALPSDNNTFTNTKISKKTIDDLYSNI
jgi:hypothetical protein